MDKTFYLETFGCQMNVVDSEKIVALLNQIGYRQVDAAAEADLILLNTCSVRDKAERKAVGHLGRFKPLKDANPNLILGIGGCVAQQVGEAFFEKVPYLDLVFGTHNVQQLPEMVLALEEKREKQSAVGFLSREERLQQFPQRSATGEVGRYVTVMQGCDNFCSYCIVPHVRGREVSRPSADILTEVRGLTRAGVREVTLIGQNVNSYGCKEEGEIDFAALLERVNAVEDLHRIRFTTSHPKDLSDELIDCFARLPKLCHHLHLPLQSGSNRVLAAMKRGYSREEYLARVERLRQVCPDIRLTTDIIVGFPGEEEADFLQTLELVEAVGYVDAFTFLYSPRPGTAAAELTDTTPAEERQRRFEQLVAVQNSISEAAWQADVGQVQEILVEGESRQGDGQMFGRNSWNRIVNFSGPASLTGELVDVKITRAFKNSQLGELLLPVGEVSAAL